MRKSSKRISRRSGKSYDPKYYKARGTSRKGQGWKVHDDMEEHFQMPNMKEQKKNYIWVMQWNVGSTTQENGKLRNIRHYVNTVNPGIIMMNETREQGL